jgi:hypothetical protein
MEPSTVGTEGYQVAEWDTISNELAVRVSHSVYLLSLLWLEQSHSKVGAVCVQGLGDLYS